MFFFLLLLLLGVSHSLHQSLIMRTKMFERYGEENTTTTSDDLVEQLQKAKNQLQDAMIDPMQPFESVSVVGVLTTLIVPDSWSNTNLTNRSMAQMKWKAIAKSSNMANSGSSFSEIVTAFIRISVYFVFYATFQAL